MAGFDLSKDFSGERMSVRINDDVHLGAIKAA